MLGGNQLKARGWRYDRHVLPPFAVFSLRDPSRPGWSIVFRKDREDFAEAVRAEARWIEEQGWLLDASPALRHLLD